MIEQNHQLSPTINYFSTSNYSVIFYYYLYISPSLLIRDGKVTLKCFTSSHQLTACARHVSFTVSWNCIIVTSYTGILSGYLLSASTSFVQSKPQTLLPSNQKVLDCRFYCESPLYEDEE